MKLSVVFLFLCLILFACSVDNNDINNANYQKEDAVYYYMDKKFLGVGLNDKEINIKLNEYLSVFLKAENENNILKYDLIITYDGEATNSINRLDNEFRISNKSGTFMIYELENYYIFHSFHGGLIDDSDVLIIDNKGFVVGKHSNVMFAFPDINYETSSFTITKQCSLESNDCDLTGEPFAVYTYEIKNNQLILLVEN